MPQQFLGNKEFLTKDIEVFASCPSNIALIKYWGKYERQIPANPSISFTLSNCKTETKMIFRSGEKFSVKTFLAGKEETKFSEKIEKYFRNIEKYLPWILQGSFVIETENTFPHSSGIASSASGFGAIAKCLMEMDKAFSGKDFFDVKKASFLARLGSGSACRSVYDGLVVWGEVNEVEGSSDLYAVKYPNEEIRPEIVESYDAEDQRERREDEGGQVQVAQFTLDVVLEEQAEHADRDGAAHRLGAPPGLGRLHAADVHSRLRHHSQRLRPHQWDRGDGRRSRGSAGSLRLHRGSDRLRPGSAQDGGDHAASRLAVPAPGLHRRCGLLRWYPVEGSDPGRRAGDGGEGQRLAGPGFDQSGQGHRHRRLLGR